MRRSLIAVVGDTHMQRGSAKRKAASALGERLADEGYLIVTGGLGDLPRALAEGARSSKNYREGCLIALVPGFDPRAAGANADVPIATGLDQARNMLVANSDAVVAIGGGAGTLSEIAFAWALKRLILAYRVDGWSGKLAGTRIDSRIRYPKLPDDQVYAVDGAEDVIRHLARLLPKYSRRHTRIAVGKEEQ